MISEIITIKHKNGRPKKVVKKEIVRSIRFSKTEYFIVKQNASKSGLKITVYIRQMALQGKIISRLSEEERQFVRQLIGMANNLNQLTKKGHRRVYYCSVCSFSKMSNIEEALKRKFNIFTSMTIISLSTLNLVQ